MTLVHRDLPQSELHNPKGFDPAGTETVMIKNEDGLLEWISIAAFGSTWLTGSGVPSSLLGITGDFYLDADVGDFYEKTSFDTWTLKGNLDGSDWFKGSGAPASGLGRPQDFYIDIVEGDIYEKTDPSTWTLITNIDGSDWFNGSGAPASGIGRPQDYYIDVVEGDIYEKVDPSTWNLITNIDGSDWFNGSGPPGSGLARKGDIYIDNDNGDLYEKVDATTWNLFTNIRGPQGIPGPLANIVEDLSPELGADLDGLGHSLLNVGTYNGVTIESHADRHLPGGDDPIATASAVALAPNGGSTEGSAESLARSDHSHNLPVAAPTGALSANTTNQAGSSGNFARSDHVHAIATGVPSTLPPDQTNAAGTSANLARADHIHNVPAAIAISTSDNNAEGIAPSFARSDHIHNTFPIFEFHDAEDDTPQTTTAGSTEGLSLTTAALAGGRYRIGWFFEWGYDDTGANFLAQVQIDNTTTIMNQIAEPSDAGGGGPGGTDQRHPVGGFAYANLTPGVHTIDFDYGSSFFAAATLWRVRLELWRVS